VFDRSKGMSEEKRLPLAIRGANELIELLSDQDSVSLIGMGEKPRWLIKDLALKTGRDRINQAIGDIKPERDPADTALYDAISQAHDYLKETPRHGTQQVIIVISIAKNIEGIYLAKTCLRGLKRRKS